MAVGTAAVTNEDAEGAKDAERKAQRETMNTTRIAKGALAGAIGGLAGTYAMNHFQRWWSHSVRGAEPVSAAGRHDARDWQELAEGQNSNEIAAQTAAVHTIGRPLDRGELKVGATAVRTMSAANANSSASRIQVANLSQICRPAISSAARLKTSAITLDRAWMAPKLTTKTAAASMASATKPAISLKLSSSSMVLVPRCPQIDPAHALTQAGLEASSA